VHIYGTEHLALIGFMITIIVYIITVSDIIMVMHIYGTFSLV